MLVQHRLELVLVAPLDRVGAGGGGRRASAGRRRRHRSTRRGSGRARARRPASPPGSSRCDTPAPGRGGTSRRPASRSIARRGGARAGRSVRPSSTRSAAVAVRIASCATARSSTRRARSTSTAASSSSFTAEKIATAGTRSVTTNTPPALPRRTSTRPESSSTRSACRRVGLEIPSSAASAPSFGSRSPARRPARSIPSVRCSIAASNVRVARIGSTEKLGGAVTAGEVSQDPGGREGRARCPIRYQVPISVKGVPCQLSCRSLHRGDLPAPSAPG